MKMPMLAMLIFSYCKVTHYIYIVEKYMKKRTNNRVQSITQNVDKVKDRKTKKRVASLQPSLITIALNKTKFTNP